MWSMHAYDDGKLPILDPVNLLLNPLNFCNLPGSHNGIIYHNTRYDKVGFDLSNNNILSYLKPYLERIAQELLRRIKRFSHTISRGLVVYSTPQSQTLSVRMMN